MSQDEPHLSREELLAALVEGWDRFLPTLREWTPKEQERLAQVQGYARLQDLLAHVCGWHAETLQVVPALLNGTPPVRYDIDAFNAGSVARYAAHTRAEMEIEFAELSTALGTLIANLPDAAFENKQVYFWLWINAVDHYHDHQLPATPPDPSAT
jgi:hypothetical protein